MSDWEKIFYTSASTIIGGVLVFCIGQLIQGFLLEPIQELKKTIGELCFRLTYYASWYMNPGPRLTEHQNNQLDAVSKALRESASRLETNVYVIPGYDLFEAIKILPKRSNVEQAIKNLIFVSNSITTEDPEEKKEVRRQAVEIRELVGCKVRKYY